jgi:hypothetical protein
MYVTTGIVSVVMGQFTLYGGRFSAGCKKSWICIIYRATVMVERNKPSSTP